MADIYQDPRSRLNNAGRPVIREAVKSVRPDAVEAEVTERSRMVHHVHTDTSDVGIFKVIRGGSDVSDDDLFDRDVIAGFDLVAGFDSGEN